MRRERSVPKANEALFESEIGQWRMQHGGHVALKKDLVPTHRATSTSKMFYG